MSLVGRHRWWRKGEEAGNGGGEESARAEKVEFEEFKENKLLFDQRFSDVCCFRWRVLALKVKFGLGANFLAVKKRNLNDISTFIDQETEVVNCFYEDENTSLWAFDNDKTIFRKPQKKIRWTWKGNV